ncbi:hypothetical protein ACFOZ0_22395 [Streptomyces yaanensis]|uniref:Uncharacterized protein n=1 Tax=Streptomyces yaanensis TaxID=1142239 RepID=A0ABV7SIJ5_9ACTN|nr:hypothetical protein [Streptomyces sp. CGMCC 4.7035]WNB97425.1 hypothetical protein Q2K21_04695 [Streptomyces sp. CGMCC 4.7035]
MDRISSQAAQGGITRPRSRATPSSSGPSTATTAMARRPVADPEV